MLEAALLMVYEARLRPEALRFAPWVEGQWAKIERALDAIEAKLVAGVLGQVPAARQHAGELMALYGQMEGRR